MSFNDVNNDYHLDDSSRSRPSISMNEENDFIMMQFHGDSNVLYHDDGNNNNNNNVNDLNFSQVVPMGANNNTKPTPIEMIQPSYLNINVKDYSNSANNTKIKFNTPQKDLRSPHHQHHYNAMNNHTSNINALSINNTNNHHVTTKAISTVINQQHHLPPQQLYVNNSNNNTIGHHNYQLGTPSTPPRNDPVPLLSNPRPFPQSCTGSKLPPRQTPYQHQQQQQSSVVNKLIFDDDDDDAGNCEPKCAICCQITLFILLMRRYCRLC